MNIIDTRTIDYLFGGLRSASCAFCCCFWCKEKDKYKWRLKRRLRKTKKKCEAKKEKNICVYEEIPWSSRECPGQLAWDRVRDAGEGESNMNVIEVKRKGSSADPNVMRSCFSLSGFSQFERALPLLQRGMLSTIEHIGNNIVQRPRYNEMMTKSGVCACIYKGANKRKKGINSGEKERYQAPPYPSHSPLHPTFNKMQRARVMF